MIMKQIVKKSLNMDLTLFKQVVEGDESDFVHITHVITRIILVLFLSESDMF